MSHTLYFWKGNKVLLRNLLSKPPRSQIQTHPFRKKRLLQREKFVQVSQIRSTSQGGQRTLFPSSS